MMSYTPFRYVRLASCAE